MDGWTILELSREKRGIDARTEEGNFHTSFAFLFPFVLDYGLGGNSKGNFLLSREEVKKIFSAIIEQKGL